MTGGSRTQPTLEVVGSGRDNNLNLLRFVSAFAVLASHSFALAGRPEPLFLGRTAGSLAVDVFFVTSGYLVARSMVDSDAGLYVRSRLLRIYPGLIVSVVATVLAVGLLGTSRALPSFFLDEQTIKYFATNATLLPSFIELDLPGAFLANPYPSDVNGSLWTLPWEMRCYAMLGLLAALTNRLSDRRRARQRLILAIGVIVVVVRLALLYWERPVSTFVGQGLRFVPVFFTGALAYVLRRWIRMSWVFAMLAAAALAVGWVVLAESRLFDALYLVTVWYLVLAAAFLPGGRIRRFNSLDDVSYGLYIYAFPVQQLTAARIDRISPFALFAVSGVLTFGLALASWRLVEQPALRLRTSAWWSARRSDQRAARGRTT